MRRESHAEQGGMRESMPPDKPRVLRDVEPMREPLPEVRHLTMSLEEGQRWLAELRARARALGCLPRWRHEQPTPPREELLALINTQAPSEVHPPSVLPE
jgi:hypothetical protein